MLVEVAAPVPLRTLFTYHVPEPMRGRVSVGVRVLVPFGRRRVTGYVVREVMAPPEGVSAKDLLDVLDDVPAFSSELLRLYEWIARYYHEALGEVIRAGLPAGLSVEEQRVVALSEEGSARLSAVLDTGLDRETRALLSALTSGPLTQERLLEVARVRSACLVNAAASGWVLVENRRSASVSRQRIEKIAVFVSDLTGKPASAKDAAVLSRVREAGELPVSVLNKEMKRVAPNLERLAAAGTIRVEERRQWRHVASVDTELGGSTSAVHLTARQADVVERLGRAIAEREPSGFLLHGVTGSGKTEVYLQCIARALSAGKGAIVLVPEIALTPQLVARFQARFGERIAVLHSALSAGERIDAWEMISTGDKPVVVGARSAIFAPVPSLGIVVVDEEHESSFKQGERPRYNARDLALVRGRLAECPVVLGSATPSLETIHNASMGKLERLELPERARAQALPEVVLVDLRRTQRLGESGLISARLAAELHAVVERGEQAILFINRRGFSSFLLCQECGFIPECAACSISLTYTRQRQALRCHYCGHGEPVVERCPHCGGSMEPVGAGTERVADDIQALVGPHVPVARMDRDTAQGKEMETLLREFRRGKLQVLVGTQMVAKGHDFPNVTLVGVLAADQSLRFPDFRAGERTFQLVTQVAGRAGRGHLAGRVIVQTWCPEHHSLAAAAGHDFHAYAKVELQRRREQGYPPFSHLALVLITHPQADAAQQMANDLAHRLRGVAAEREGGGGGALWVLGPVWAPLQRLKHKSRAQILLKARERSALHGVLAWLDAWTDHHGLHGQIAVDVDPLHMS